MHLYAAACAALFGGEGGHPYRTATIRLATALAAVTVTGIVIAQGIPDMLWDTSPRPQLANTVIIATEVAVLLPLLSATGPLHDRTDTSSRLLLSLPLKAASRSAALLLPGLLVALLSLILVSYPLSVVALDMGLPAALLPGSLAGGALAAFGLAYGIPPWHWSIRMTCTVLIVRGQYMLSGIVSNPALVPSMRNLAAVSSLLFMLLPILLSMRSGHELTARLSRARTHRAIRRNGPSAPIVWFARKIWRNGTTKTGLMTAILLSTGAAFVSWRQNMIPAEMHGIIAAILAAAFCSDTRALSRRGTPFEIAGLRGTARFLAHYLVITGCFGLLAISPLIWAMFVLTPQAATTGLSYAAVGMAAGIFSGTLFSAGRRDTLAQGAASLLSLSILLIPTQVPLLAGFTLTERHVFNVALILVLAAAAAIIEYKRNSFRWRISYVR